MKAEEFKKIKDEWKKGKFNFYEFLKKWEELRNRKPPKQEKLFRMQSPEKLKRSEAYKY